MRKMDKKRIVGWFGTDGKRIEKRILWEWDGNWMGDEWDEGRQRR